MESNFHIENRSDCLYPIALLWSRTIDSQKCLISNTCLHRKRHKHYHPLSHKDSFNTNIVGLPGTRMRLYRGIRCVAKARSRGGALNCFLIARHELALTCIHVFVPPMCISHVCARLYLHKWINEQEGHRERNKRKNERRKNRESETRAG